MRASCASDTPCCLRGGEGRGGEWKGTRQRRRWKTCKRHLRAEVCVLTWLEACRILERKGTMAHSTDRNQKMKRTPEDWTPRNLSNWIRNVAKSWVRREGNITQREEKEGGCKRRDWVRLAKTELLRACEVKHNLTESVFHADCSCIKCWVRRAAAVICRLFCNPT